MNRFILLICVVTIPWTLFAGNLETVVLDVKNMTCAVCPITVRKALQKIPGVTTAEVDFDKKTARVTFDPEKCVRSRFGQCSGTGFSFCGA
jgi:periplasmic mercuric ion binding protein